jgi:hypothetical protein
MAAAEMAALGRRMPLVDLDSQGNGAVGLSVKDTHTDEVTTTKRLADPLMGRSGVKQADRKSLRPLSAPWSPSGSAAERQLLVEAAIRGLKSYDRLPCSGARHAGRPASSRERLLPSFRDRKIPKLDQQPQ